MDEDGSIVIVEGEYSANLDIAHMMKAREEDETSVESRKFKMDNIHSWKKIYSGNGIGE
jgi:hypothetical protein